jgi:hypothetical protein
LPVIGATRGMVSSFLETSGLRVPKAMWPADDGREPRAS